MQLENLHLKLETWQQQVTVHVLDPGRRRSAEQQSPLNASLASLQLLSGQPSWHQPRSRCHDIGYNIIKFVISQNGYDIT